MALAQIEETRRLKLPQRSAELGATLLKRLRSLGNARGIGLMAGLEVSTGDQALSLVKTMLKRGYILLPEGELGNVIAFMPPLVISQRELDRTVAALENLLSQPGLVNRRS
jgi:4-aminobutyrate aminotransferase-like enzyme